MRAAFLVVATALVGCHAAQAPSDPSAVPARARPPVASAPASSAPADAPATPPAPAASPIDEVKAALAARDWRSAREAIERARTAATTDAARATVAYFEATLRTYEGDPAAATAILEAELERWRPQRTETRAYWELNALTWLDWSRGRVQSALKRVEDSGAWLDASALPDEQRRSLRLHYLWDRAYLLLDQALEDGRLDKAERKTADAARDEYVARAVEWKDETGVDVIRLFFAVGEGDAASADRLAAKLVASKTDDVQDVYVLHEALARRGDDAGAAAVERRIRATDNPYLMHAIVVNRLNAAPSRPAAR